MIIINHYYNKNKIILLFYLHNKK